MPKTARKVQQPEQPEPQQPARYFPEPPPDGYLQRVQHAVAGLFESGSTFRPELEVILELERTIRKETWAHKRSGTLAALEQSAEGQSCDGSSIACFRLGAIYLRGRAVPHDFERGMALLRRAKEGGYPVEAVELGDLLGVQWRAEVRRTDRLQALYGEGRLDEATEGYSRAAAAYFQRAFRFRKQLERELLTAGAGMPEPEREAAAAELRARLEPQIEAAERHFQRCIRLNLLEGAALSIAARNPLWPAPARTEISVYQPSDSFPGEHADELEDLFRDPVLGERARRRKLTEDEYAAFRFRPDVAGTLASLLQRSTEMDGKLPVRTIDDELEAGGESAIALSERSAALQRVAGMDLNCGRLTAAELARVEEAVDEFLAPEGARPGIASKRWMEALAPFLTYRFQDEVWRNFSKPEQDQILYARRRVAECDDLNDVPPISRALAAKLAALLMRGNIAGMTRANVAFRREGNFYGSEVHGYLGVGGLDVPEDRVLARFAVEWTVATAVRGARGITDTTAAGELIRGVVQFHDDQVAPWAELQGKSSNPRSIRFLRSLLEYYQRNSVLTQPQLDKVLPTLLDYQTWAHDVAPPKAGASASFLMLPSAEDEPGALSEETETE